MVKETKRGRPTTRSLTRAGIRPSESIPLSKDASTHKRDFISALPDEILLRILEYLPDILHPRSKFTVTGLEGGEIRPRRPILDYASVALTCRSLNRAATTMMYRKYDHCYDTNHCYDTEPSTRFIRSLIANPALGALVKEMKEIGNVSIKDRHMKSRIRSSRNVQMLCSKIESLAIPKGEEYATLFRKGEDAFSALESALILWLTPNIETVALNCCPGARAEGENLRWVQRQPQAALLPIISAGRGIPYGRVHQFTRLKRLSIRMKGVHINFLSPILRLDSLREVFLSDNDYPESSPSDPPCTWECPSKTSKVEKIRLDDFDCDLGMLENLLGSCQALTSFSWGVSGRAARGDIQWQWSEAKALLETLQPGLQALELCESRHNSDTRLGTLQQFASLRYLAVPIELLISPLDEPEEPSLDKLLPMGLETLVLSKGWDSHGGRGVDDLRYDRTVCDPAVQSLLDACRSRSIRLQKFGIIMYATDHHFEPSETDIDVHFNFHEYAIQCKQYGIHFDYVIQVRTPGDYLPDFVESWSTANEELADEYMKHLSFPDGWPSYGYQLQGITKPAFFDTYDDAYILDHRTFVRKKRDED